MLVLSRKKNQSIVINDDIEVFVVDVVNDQVKLGIRAPQNVSIHRKEVYDNIKQEMAQAASASPEGLKNLDKIRLPAGAPLRPPLGGNKPLGTPVVPKDPGDKPPGA